MAKKRVRLLSSYGGGAFGLDSPAAGTVVEVDEKLAEGLVEAGQAELAERREDDKPKRKTAKRGATKAEIAAEDGPEKR